MKKDWRKYLTNGNIMAALLLLFALWLMLWDDNHMSNLNRVDELIEQAVQERDYYQSLIDADSLVIEGLRDSSFLERYARENYFYTKQGETLYLINKQ